MGNKNQPDLTLHVYALHAGDYNFRYVGVTKLKLRRRLYAHRSGVRSGDRSPVSMWMSECGLDTIEIHSLEQFSDVNDANRLERKWMDELRSQGFDLVNQHKLPSSHHLSAHTRAKMSELKKAYWAERRQEKQIRDAVIKELLADPDIQERIDLMIQERKVKAAASTT